MRWSSISRSFNSAVLKFSLLVGLSLFIARLLHWALPMPLFLLMILLQAVLFALFAAAVIWSAVYLFRQFKLQKAKAFIPIAINAIVLAILLKFPFLKTWLNINFLTLKSARQDVVSLVESNALPVSNSGQIELPPQFRSTSDGGHIQLDDSNILFYTFRGIDNYAGFVYIPDNQAPRVGDLFFYGKIVDVQKISDRWFWISAT